MVKFSKQLEGQLVPEWRTAYVNYKLLKKDLKRIKEEEDARRASELESQSSFAPNVHGRRNSNFGRMQDSFENFVALTGQALAGHRGGRRSQRSSILQVSKADGDSFETYETVLVEPSDFDGPFFTRLDSQFNKVNQFYRIKEKEFIEHADVLEKQMQALVEMKRRFAERKKYQRLPTEGTENGDERCQDAMEEGRFGSGSTNSTRNEVGGDICTKDGLHRAHDGNGGVAACLNIEGQGMGMKTETEMGPGPTGGRGGGGGGSSEISSSKDGDSEMAAQFVPSEFTMRMRIPTSTPGTAISTISQSLWEDVVKQVNRSWSNPYAKEKVVAEDFVVTKKKIQLAEKMLRAAFIEYYRGLGMLKSYSSLNMVAFAKINKKYDKVSGKRAAAVYLKAVETSYFSTSDKIVKLMDKVENLFTKHFAGNNHRKAMINLRPTQRRASHKVTFILGLFSGGSLSLLAVFSVLVHHLLPLYGADDSIDQGSGAEGGNRVYFTTIFPTFSMVALILLHMYMYGVDLYFWRRARINYPFIFEFQPGTELRHREVLMVASILTTLLMGAMVGQLTLHASSHAPFADLIPFLLVMAFVTLLLFPFNMCYRSSRVFFLNALLHILGAPLYKVVLADFFLADQLTSQVPMLRNLEYVMCFYFGGFFKTGSPQSCLDNDVYKGLTYLISLSPYWWRLMQCVRRFVDESDYAHVANGGKYLSALVAVAIRIQYGLAGSRAWLGLTIVSSTVATVYQLYWDIVVDWGLLRKKSRNMWLRDQLIMPRQKYVYFLSMAVNAALRLAWLQSVTRFKFGNLDQQVMDFGFAALEVIRRGQWNFFRLENEHLNNVGKFRATKTVPLPFEDPTAAEEDD